jgi:hypothetical protein
LKKVLSLRQISKQQQLYEQLPRIKRYIFDSYHFGELNTLSKKPTEKYLEEKLAKQLQ